MQDDSIEIEGKVYVPSKRAAKLVGYTKDYVGQLSRGGYLDAKLVGRSWFVTEDSIRAHKLKVHHELKQQRIISSNKAEVSDEKTNKVKVISDSTVDEVKSNSDVTETVSVSKTLLQEVPDPTASRFEGGRILIRKDVGQYARRELLRSKIEYEQENPFSYDSVVQKSQESSLGSNVAMRRVANAPGVSHSTTDSVTLRARSVQSDFSSRPLSTPAPRVDTQLKRSVHPTLNGLARSSKVVHEDVYTDSVDSVAMESEDGDASLLFGSKLRLVMFVVIIISLLLPIVYILWEMFAA